MSELVDSKSIAELSVEELKVRVERLEAEIEQASQDTARFSRDERRYRTIAEHARDLIWTMDLNLKYTYISPSVQDIRGYTVEEAMIQTIEQTATKESLPKLRDAFLETLALDAKGELKPRFSTIMEFEITCKDGSTRWMEGNMTFVRDDEGKPVEVLGIARDITERRLNEDSRRAASRMEATATLAGGIAHDFNNLMVSVLGNATLVRDSLGDGHECASMLEAIEEAAVKAGSLAQQALAFARGGKYNPRILNLNKLVEEVLKIERKSFPSDVDIELSLESDLSTVSADSNQLMQIINHFCLNSFEAMEGYGKICVSTENCLVEEKYAARHAGMTPGEYVKLTVKDSGPGMDYETLQRIFEPYFTTKTRGRGLGLSAAYGIVKNHKGFMHAENHSSGGAVFSVYLPVVASKMEIREKTVATLPQGSETVLVVDDEQAVLSVTKLLLERYGYHVLPAASGEEAIDIARSYSGDIHAALLDMAMPKMDGSQTFQVLSKLRPDMKVIICSGFDLDRKTQILLDAGASSFLHKPFRAPELGIKIREAVG